MNANRQKIIKLAEQKDISKMSYREIGRELGIENPQTVIYHIEQLKKKGLLYFDSQKKCQKVAKLEAFTTDKMFNIPIVGYASCGPALALTQDAIQGYLKISQKSIRRSSPQGLIAVKAVGNSLDKANINGDNIENGDYVIVNCNKTPENGDYVLSHIDGAANFKKYYKDDKRKEIRLVSESTMDMPPIVLHREDLDAFGYAVNGVVVRVVKF
ncbi:MAG: S24 family peptidase [Candidatus Pacebacteria bacterium]|nr:S24 family peptidase [Candidatus Paceibacterota bacterium]MDD4830570.1 S24 family peptidase [Candidatus Paceibacterota bacterium]MDD4874945.1 S24 family peptidase [Candidatus Paceibacterota bacterium]